ncbi:MAG: hypothetical protein NNA20_06910 [Nitrospira sp.]|nr:hypothetical protein [Nitrospira sp.]
MAIDTLLEFGRRNQIERRRSLEGDSERLRKSDQSRLMPARLMPDGLMPDGIGLARESVVRTASDPISLENRRVQVSFQEGFPMNHGEGGPLWIF